MKKIISIILVIAIVFTLTGATLFFTSANDLPIHPATTLMSLTYTVDSTPADNYFAATGGLYQSASTLTAWDSDTQITIGGAGNRTPIVINNAATSTTTGWQAASVVGLDNATAFEIKFRTTDFQNIGFSASQKSTGSGPDTFRLAYRIGSEGDFTPIANSEVKPVRIGNDTYAALAPTYEGFILPALLADQGEVYLRVVFDGITTLGRNGNTSINDIEIVGDAILAGFVYPEATAANGNQFPANFGLFVNTPTFAPALTAWDSNAQTTIGGTGRTPIVFNNAALTQGVTNWQPASAVGIDNASAFQIKFSTLGYDRISFSASQKSTGSGPDAFFLAYRIGATGDFTAIPDSRVLPVRVGNDTYAALEQSYDTFVLPAELANKDEVYLRVVFDGLATLGRNGNTSINDIVIAAYSGRVAEDDEPLPLSDIIINQVYGSGPLDGTGSISHSFIELYNTTDEPVSLEGMSLQLRSGGTSNAPLSPWEKLDFLASDIIPAKSSFLIRLHDVRDGPTNAGDVIYVIPEADVDWTHCEILSNRSFAAALVNNQTLLPETEITAPTDNENIIDLVGVRNSATDTTPPFWGALAQIISKQASARRADFKNTAVNSADFVRIQYRDTFGPSAVLLEATINRPRSSSDGPWLDTAERTTLQEQLAILEAFDKQYWTADLTAMYTAAKTAGDALVAAPEPAKAAMRQAIADLLLVLDEAAKGPNAYFENEYAKAGVPLVVRTTGLVGTVTYTWETGTVNSSGAVSWTTVSGNNTNSLTPTTGQMERFIRVTVSAPQTPGGFNMPLTMYASSLPVVYINLDDNFNIDNVNNNFDNPNHATFGQGFNRVTYRPGEIIVQGNDEFNSSNTNLYNGRAQLRGRGNWTWNSLNTNKRPFRIRLDNRNNMFNLGGQPNRHWIMLAGVQDRTLTKNRLMTDLSYDLGMEWHANSTHTVVVVNGQYRGLYQFVEHNRVAPDRVDVFDWEDTAESAARAIASRERFDAATTIELEDAMDADLSWITSASKNFTFKGVTYHVPDYFNIPTDIAGGYYLEIDHHGGESYISAYYNYSNPTIWRSGLNQELVARKPGYLKTNTDMHDYVKNYLNTFEAALRAGNFSTTYTGTVPFNNGIRVIEPGDTVHYTDMIDLDTFTGYFIPNEFCQNSDFMQYSGHFYIGHNDKMKMGPLWDYDWTWEAGRSSTAWAYRARGTVNWYRYMQMDPLFIVRLYEKYQTLARPVFTDITRSGGRLDQVAEKISAQVASNNTRWNHTTTHASSVTTLRNNMNNRVNWMNTQFNTISSLATSLGYVRNSGLTVADPELTGPRQLTLTANVTGTNIARVTFLVNGVVAGNAQVIGGRAVLNIPTSMQVSEEGVLNVVEIKGQNSSGAYMTNGNYQVATNRSHTIYVANFNTFETISGAIDGVNVTIDASATAVKWAGQAITLSADVLSEAAVTSMLWSVTTAPANAVYSFAPLFNASTTTFTTDTPGTYTIRFAAENAEGDTDFDEVTFVVRSSTYPPTIDAVDSPDLMTLDKPDTFSVSATSNHPSGTLTYEWSVSPAVDGIVMTGANTASPTLTFANYGTYFVTVTVSDENGSVSETVKTVVSEELVTLPEVNLTRSAVYTAAEGNIARLTANPNVRQFANSGTTLYTASTGAGIDRTGINATYANTTNGANNVQIPRITDGTRSGTAANTSWNSWGNAAGTTTNPLYVILNWGEPFVIDSLRVEWWQDGGGVRLPTSAIVEYLDVTVWRPVPNMRNAAGAAVNSIGVADRGTWNGITFDPITTTQLRLRIVKSATGTDGAGISEWEVFGIKASDITQAPVADKTALATAIGNYQKLDAADWTAESFALATTAYNAGMIVFLDGHAAQEVVNDAAAALANAIAALAPVVIVEPNGDPDINKDYAVDFEDLAVVMFVFGAEVNETNKNTSIGWLDKTPERAPITFFDVDIWRDGKIDIGDLQFLISNFTVDW